MTSNGVALSAQEVEPWGFGFFPVHGPLHFIMLKFSLLTFFILLKWRKKGKESQFSPAADIDPKVTVGHKIIPGRPIGRKYHEFWLKEEGMQRLVLYNRYWDLFISLWNRNLINGQVFFFCVFFFSVGFFSPFFFFPGSRLRQGCLCSLFLVVTIFSSN